MRCVGHFDNSADNPNNPDPNRVVAFGEQTNDEMLIGYMDVALDYQDLSVGPPRVVARRRRPVRRDLSPPSARGRQDGPPRRQLQQGLLARPEARRPRQPGDCSPQP